MAVDRTSQVISASSAAPTNISSTDAISQTASQPSTTMTNNSAGGIVASSVQQNPSTSTLSQLQSAGINFTPVQNQLNTWANYTYHIRFSITSEQTAQNANGTKSYLDNASKYIIAESGVTAGFNISEFEFHNLCTPGPLHRNTTATDWSMTIVEAYGISFLDRLIMASASLGVKHYAKAPYMIDIWFNGYDEDGNIQASNQFYTQLRVSVLKIDIKATEAGGTYALSGCIDGDIGHSNEISTPEFKFSISNVTVLGDFFDTLADALTDQSAKIATSGIPQTVYQFIVPPEITKFTLKSSDITLNHIRSAGMAANPANGGTDISGNKGMSIENIANAILATCDQTPAWVNAQSSSGMTRWILVHSTVEMIDFITTIQDYTRSVTYSIIPYYSQIPIPDFKIVTDTASQNTQTQKLSWLASNNALVKEYDYIYTGLNTEIISFDIALDFSWTIPLPQYDALLSYYNFSQGPLKAKDSAGDALATGKPLPTSGSSTNIAANPTNEDSNQYIEDLSTSNGKFPISIRPTNKPTQQNTDIGTDGIKATSASKDGTVAPSSRAQLGSYMDAIFTNKASFLDVTITIRGDPYWMGSGSVLETTYAHQLASGKSVSIANKALYLSSNIGFILAFRTGTNYDEKTGLMNFDTNSTLFNGLYIVQEVTNSFKSGSFTQTLKAYKDPLSQSAEKGKS